jgi:uncharacterized protein
MKHVPAALVTAVAVQVLCQIFKTIFYSIRDKKFNLYYLTTTGGIPSAHSAFVTALTVSVGIQSGFVSDLFAVSAVFSIIVIYDAMRVRNAVEAQAKLLNRLVKNHFPEEKPDLREMIGHSVLEIVLGVVIGAGLSAAVTLWLFPDLPR